MALSKIEDNEGYRIRKAKLEKGDKRRTKRNGSVSGEPSKEFQRRQAERRRTELAKNFGFCDEQTAPKLCDDCGWEQPDVHPFMVRNTGLGSRIAPEARRNLCEACVEGMIEAGTAFRAIADEILGPSEAPEPGNNPANNAYRMNLIAEKEGTAVDSQRDPYYILRRRLTH